MSEARHLAQLNIGRFRYPTDDPRMADFMNNLDLVNGLAERSKGFVWRLKDDSGNLDDRFSALIRGKQSIEHRHPHEF